MSRMENISTSTWVDIINETANHFLANGAYEIRSRLFPDANTSYLEEGANNTFEMFFAKLDSNNKAKYIEMVKSDKVKSHS